MKEKNSVCWLYFDKKAEDVLNQIVLVALTSQPEEANVAISVVVDAIKLDCAAYDVDFR